MDRKRKLQQNKRLEKQRIARRKRYAEIKQDSVLYHLEKEKEKRRYQKRKDEKKIKSVNEKSPREQREERKKWREASKKYRQKKKEQSQVKPEPEEPDEEEVLIDASTVASSETEAQYGDPLTLDATPPAEVQIRRIRLIEQKKRKCLMRIIMKLNEENNLLKVKLDMCRRDMESRAEKRTKIKGQRKQLESDK